MKLTITGKQVDISDAFKSSVKDGLDVLSDKHQMGAMDVTVVLSKEGPFFHTDLKAHISRGLTLRSSAKGEDAYSSFSNSLDTLVSRLRKHKKRLTDHHKHRDIHISEEKMSHYVLNGYDHPEDNAPPVIAETTLEVPTLSVGDALMRMDLSERSTFIFKNSMNERINVLYRRDDGNIGWVDPKEA